MSLVPVNPADASCSVVDEGDCLCLTSRCRVATVFDCMLTLLSRGIWAEFDVCFEDFV